MVNMKLFDEDYYTKTYPSVKKYMMLPIDHYLKIGWHLGYNPTAILTPWNTKSALLEQNLTLCITF